jgi:hypothetical protein
VLMLLVPLGCPLSPEDRPGIDTLGKAILKGRKLEEDSLAGLCWRSVMVRCRCRDGALEDAEFLRRASGRPVVGSRSGKWSSFVAVVGFDLPA